MGVIEDTLNKYPEHAKMIAITNRSQLDGELLEWLGEAGYTICKYDEDGHGFFPVNKSIPELLAERYDIDLDKIEAEKRQMIKELLA